MITFEEYFDSSGRKGEEGRWTAVSRQPSAFTFFNSAARWRGCRVPDAYMAYRASSMGASLGLESGGRMHHTRAAQCGWPRLSRFSIHSPAAHICPDPQGPHNAAPYLESWRPAPYMDAMAATCRVRDRPRSSCYVQAHEATGEDSFESSFSQQLQVLHFHVLRSIDFTRLLYHSGGFFGENYFPNAPRYS